MLRPFFTYYGGKWRAAKLYPAPTRPQVVEPFAGSAGYACFYEPPAVTLADADPVICGVWRYLIRASTAEILALPDLLPGQTTDALAICQEAKWLIGFWLNGGSATPKKSLSKWARQQTNNGGPGWATGGGQLTWGQRVRERLAVQVDRIRHWRVIERSFDGLGNKDVTWFIDPPYQVKGKYYRYSAVDYTHLLHGAANAKGKSSCARMTAPRGSPSSRSRRSRARSALSAVPKSCGARPLPLEPSLASPRSRGSTAHDAAAQYQLRELAHRALGGRASART